MDLMKNSVKKHNSLKKNILFQVIYEILILILPLITSPYITRVIGAEGLGIYSYTYSIAYYFVLFANLGIFNYGNRAIAKCGNDEEELSKTFYEIIIIHIVMSFLCIFAYVIYYNFNDENKIYVLIQGLYIIGALFDISWFYFGIERFDFAVFVNIITKILTVVLNFLLVKSKNDLSIYCLILALGTFIGQVILWFPIKKYVHYVPVSFIGVTRHIKSLLVLFIPAIAVSLYKYMDKIMLGSIGSKVQLGFYDNSEKVINIPSTVITAFGTVMLPRMSKLISENQKSNSKKYIDMSMRYIMILAIGLSFGLIGVSKVFSIVFWGDEFAYCSNLIKGLALSIPFFSFANIVRTQYLIPNEKDQEYLISIIAGAVINLIVNYILISKLIALGAVIGTVMAEATVCIIQSCFTANKLPIGNYVIKNIPFLLSGLFMSLIVNAIGSLLGNTVLSLIIQIFLGALFYLICCVLILYYYKDDFLIKKIACYFR